MNAIKTAAAVLALGVMCIAQTVPSTSTTTTTTTTKSGTHKVHKSSAASPSTRETLLELKNLLQQQQQQTNELKQQVDELKQQMSQRDAQLQQLQQAQTTAADEQAKASAAQTATSEQAQQAKAETETVKQTLATTVTTVQQDQKKMAAAMENPEKIHYKGVTLTPGGFLAAETTFRNHAMQNDNLSVYNAIPFDRDPRTHLTEFRANARQSRISLLIEGKAGTTKLSGYYELDFLGAAPTANENQSSSFQPRTRQLFAQAALDNGWTFTGGQTWSLISLNKKGISTLSEWLPATIDSQYVAGFNYGRLYSARVTKTLSKKVAAAIAFENHADLPTGAIPANISGVPGGVLSAGTGALANGLNFSTAVMPDVIAKVAFDPGWGHYEVKGVMRVFRDHVLGTDTNQKKVGGGFGAGAILPLKKNKIDFYAETLIGNGTSRYNDSGNADFYIRPDGNLELVRAVSFLSGIETHFTPKLDWYTYFGTEYQQRSAGILAGTAYGYGSPGADYSKCFATESTFACTAPFKNLSQVATGFWYRFYKGTMGTLQYGMEYSYTQRNAWSGLNGPAGSPGVSPEGSLNTVYTSFRYYIP
jgi:hypothetical protein